MTGVNGRPEDALLKAFPAFISVPAAIASRYRCQKERKIQQDPKKNKAHPATCVTKWIALPFPVASCLEGHVVNEPAQDQQAAHQTDTIAEDINSRHLTHPSPKRRSAPPVEEEYIR
jgi:hypothetical protein